MKNEKKMENILLDDYLFFRLLIYLVMFSIIFQLFFIKWTLRISNGKEVQSNTP